MRICPECSSENPADAVKCVSCGTTLPDDATTLTFPVAPTEHGEEAVTHDASGLEAELVVEKGPNQGARYVVHEGRLLIGRDPENDVFLDDVTVSRHHAVLTLEDGSYHIHDVGSLNGTYLNSERVTRADVKSGDRIWIGRYRLLFLRPV